jgi:hypothetical protein
VSISSLGVVQERPEPKYPEIVVYSEYLALEGKGVTGDRDLSRQTLLLVKEQEINLLAICYVPSNATRKGITLMTELMAGALGLFTHLRFPRHSELFAAICVD